MSGSPIIPIQFFGKTRKLSTTEFAVAPIEEVEEVIEYATNPDVPLYKFRVSPANQDDADKSFSGTGDVADAPSPAAPVPPERDSGDHSA